MCCYNVEIRVLIIDKASRDLLYEECKRCDKEDTMLWITLKLLKLKASKGGQRVVSKLS
jgi:hypothetical protein